MPQAGMLYTALSTSTIWTVGLLSKLFLYGAARTTVTGLPAFLSLLESRRRSLAAGEPIPRGLLTASNHKSVFDDPLIWGTLPLSHLLLGPANHRHALGSADICFTTLPTSVLFRLGQVHQTYRLHKSPLGGLFQPTLNALPQLLDGGAWVHIFPEGRVHQHEAQQMRYFKWGVARLLLEPRVQPTFVPMFVTGLERVMAEDRGFPRFLPRVGKRIRVVYGAAVDDGRFADLRGEWRALCEREGAARIEDSEVLRTGREAVALRIEATRRVREEVLKLRRSLGYPDEEPGAGDPDTYRLPGMDAKEGRLADGTLVKDT